MKKKTEARARRGEFRSAYELRELLQGRGRRKSRGRHGAGSPYKAGSRYKAGPRVAVLEPDVAAVFAEDAVVNDALRALYEIGLLVLVMGTEGNRALTRGLRRCPVTGRRSRRRR